MTSVSSAICEATIVASLTIQMLCRQPEGLVTKRFTGHNE
jgi:hypothetical protein